MNKKKIKKLGKSPRKDLKKNHKKIYTKKIFNKLLRGRREGKLAVAIDHVDNSENWNLQFWNVFFIVFLYVEPEQINKKIILHDFMG